MGVPKLKWTAQEEAAVRAGIKRYGPGKWSLILRDPEFGPILRLRTNVDIKDKWRNIQLVSGETGTRQRHKYSAENIQPNTDHVDILGNSSTSVDVEFKVRDKPLRRTKETLPTRAPTERMSRLNSRIMEAIAYLDEPLGSTKSAIAKHLEEQYPRPPKFESLLAGHLRHLINMGKVVKVNHLYRIATSSSTDDVKDPPLHLDQKKVSPRPETSGGKVLTSRPRRGRPRKVDTRVNEFAASSLPPQEKKKESPKRKRKSIEVLTQADIDAEIERIRRMTPEAAAAAAARAVEEAEASLAEAEAAQREAEEAEREAEAAQREAKAARHEAALAKKRARAKAKGKAFRYW